MSKAFVVSDVHGFYDKLIEALDKAGWDPNNPDHVFISCGDLLDRGEQPIECLDFVNNLPEERKILIRGNHEDLLLAAICRRYFENHDFHNRTVNTAYDLVGKDMSEDESEILGLVNKDERWNKYLNSTIDYYENDDYIFVHGWIPTDPKPSGTSMTDFLKDYYNPKYQYNKNWRDAEAWEWQEARWLNGMSMWNQGIKEDNKTIFCGHWHTSWGHANLHNDGKEWLNKIETYYIDPDTGKQEPHVNHGPFEDDGICAIDACTAVSGIVNCKVIEDFRRN